VEASQLTVDDKTQLQRVLALFQVVLIISNVFVG